MTDLEILWLVLAVIYGWECATWVRRGSVALVNFWGRSWHLMQPGTIIGNHNGGVVFGNPLPPLGTVLVARQSPISFSPEGVLDYVAYDVNPGASRPQTVRFLAWEDIRKIEAVFKEVRINGAPFLKTASPVSALHLAAQLKRVSEAKPEKRAEAIRQLHGASFDTSALKKRWNEYLVGTKLVRRLTNGMFAYLFGVTPLVIYYFGLSTSWPWLVAGLLSLTFATAVYFRRAHSQFFPAAEDERFTQFIIILLSPATAVRAHDALSRSLLETFHPLAVAQVLCEEKPFRQFARDYWRALMHPVRTPALEASPRLAAVEASARELFRGELETFLRRQQLRVEELTRPPEPADATCHSYCPRCEAQFTTETGECADCGGLALFPLGPPPRK